VSRSGEKNPNIVPGRFVLAIKNPGFDKKFLKALFVLGGHRKREKRSIVLNSTTIKQSSVRLLLALTATLGFNIWTIEVNQAYLQAAVDLQRKIFTKPDVLRLGEDELLQVIKPLYGLSGSGDYSAETLSAHHIADLRMTQATADFSLFFKSLGGRLIGASGAHVDDMIQIGTPEFSRQTIAKLGAAFDVKTPETLPSTFTGLEISCNADGSIAGQQGSYVATLDQLLLTTSWDAFRSERKNLPGSVTQGMTLRVLCHSLS
jgi:hypothetical protein